MWNGVLYGCGCRHPSRLVEQLEQDHGQNGSDRSHLKKSRLKTGSALE
jgi:hypothetical protein